MGRAGETEAKTIEDMAFLLGSRVCETGLHSRI